MRLGQPTCVNQMPAPTTSCSVHVFNRQHHAANSGSDAQTTLVKKTDKRRARPCFQAKADPFVDFIYTSKSLGNILE